MSLTTVITHRIRARIVLYMTRNKLNKKEFASKIGVSGATVGRWISGQQRSIRNVTWKKLQSIIGIQVEVPVMTSADHEKRMLKSKINLIDAEIDHLKTRKAYMLLQLERMGGAS